MSKTEEQRKKRVIKFAPSFRQSCRDNIGMSEDEIRQVELDVIKRQKKLREGVE